MLIAIGRQLTVAIAVATLVGISVIVWPLNDANPDRQLAAAGAKLCFANDETLLVGANLEGEDVGDELVRVAAGIPSLLFLSLADTRVTQRGIESLQSLPKLWALNLSRTRWTFEALNAIGSLPALKDLRLDGCEWVNDDQLPRIASIKNLESLSLAETSVTAAGIEHLRSLPRLKHLGLERCSKINDDSMESLVRLCEGRRISLNISGTEVSREGVARLRRALPDNTIYLRPDTMVGFRDVALRGNFDTNQRGEIWGFRRRMDIDGQSILLERGDLTAVGRVTDLIELNLEQTNVDDSMLFELPQLGGLETLRLSSTLVTDAGLKIMADFPNLKTLALMDADIDGIGLTNLSHVPQLSTLRVQSRRGDEILSYLETLGEMQTLTISAPLTNDGVEQLVRFPKLKFLALIKTRIRGPGIARLAAISTLTELRFDGGLIDDSDIDALVSLKSLRYLLISQARLTHLGVHRLQTIRPDVSLNWSGNMAMSHAGR